MLDIISCEPTENQAGSTVLYYSTPLMKRQRKPGRIARCNGIFARFGAKYVLWWEGGQMVLPFGVQYLTAAAQQSPGLLD